MWGLIDKVETSKEPTLKRQLAKTCEFYIKIKLNRYYYLRVQDTFLFCFFAGLEWEEVEGLSFLRKIQEEKKFFYNVVKDTGNWTSFPYLEYSLNLFD